MTMEKHIAVFDFDGTLIKGDSVVALLFYARKKGRLSLPGLVKAGWYGLLYHLRLTDALTAKRHSHAFLARMDDREAFLKEFAGTLTARVYADGLRQIKTHQEKGQLVILCSASCQCYMRYVAETLGADALLCTPSADDGTVTGPNCRGEEKVRRVYAWLDQQRMPRDCVAFAYGDTPGDAPILRASGHPVLVNAKKKLRRLLPEAEQRSWQ